MSEFSLTAQQNAAVNSRGGELLVSAAAGSGKTKVLVQRLLARICDEDDGANIDEFLIITFTKAAASEMRSKIIEEISKRLAHNPFDNHLRRQATLVYRANIMTIHGFCASLLREFAYLVPVVPDFKVAEEVETEMILSRSIDEILEQQYQNMSDTDFGKLVDFVAAGRDDRRLCEVILDVRSGAQSHPYPRMWMDLVLKMYEIGEKTDVSTTIWGEIILNSAQNELRSMISELETAIGVILKHEILRKAYLDAFTQDIEIAESITAAMETGWDSTVLAFDSARHLKLGSSRGFDDEKILQYLKNTREAFKDCINIQKSIFDSTAEELLSDIKTLAPAVRELFDTVIKIEEDFAAAKEKRRLLDYNDLEHMTVKLLIKNYDPVSGAFDKTELAGNISGRFREIMVDEYQDTNQLQELIISAVSQKRENVFMVGDLKQSIYRFRLADPKIFLFKYKSFADVTRAEERQPRKVILSKNFRSRTQVINTVNTVFMNLMSEEFGGMVYGKNEYLYSGADYPPGKGMSAELDIINVRKADSSEEPPEKTEIEAGFVAARVRKLLDEKFEVFDSQTKTMRPVTPGDIAVLMRSPSVKSETYEQALLQFGVPVRAGGGGDFWTSPEILVMTELLALIDNPMQDISLVSVLRSPIYAFSDDRLASFRISSPTDISVKIAVSQTFTEKKTEHEYGLYGAIRREAEGGARDCADFLAELEEYTVFAAEFGVSRLIRYIYSKTNALALFGAMDAGAERRQNLLLLHEYASKFPKEGGLFAFAAHLRRLKSSGREPGFGRPAASADAVTIMSIHKSKGLEFPVVILCDLDKKFNREDLRKPVLIHPELGVGFKFLNYEKLIEYQTLPRLAIARALEEEGLFEELRVLYVAMTRAKEKLIMTCAVKDAEKILSELRYASASPQTLMKSRSIARQLFWALRETSEMRGLIDVPAERFVTDTDADIEINLISDETVSSMCENLTPSVSHKIPETENNIAAEDNEMNTAAEFIIDLNYEYPYTALSEIPSKLTATQLKGRFSDYEAAEDAPPTVREHTLRRPEFLMKKRLSGAEAGTALHLVMQYIDFSRCDNKENISAEINRLKSMELITVTQAECVDISKIERFFATPLGKEIRANKTVEREFKFSVLRDASEFFAGVKDGKIMLQGVVDCYFQDENGLYIIDFKTDFIKPGGENEKCEYYRGQLEAYAAALTEITGIKTAKKAIYFFSTEKLAEL